MSGDPLVFLYHLKEFHEKRHKIYNLGGKQYCKHSLSALKYCKNVISRQILVKIKNKSTNCHNFVNSFTLHICYQQPIPFQIKPKLYGVTCHQNLTLRSMELSESQLNCASDTLSRLGIQNFAKIKSRGEKTSPSNFSSSILIVR